MTVINTNIAATVAANAMQVNSRSMENTMERLATGKRINSASDDAAGLAIGSRMEAQIRGLAQAARNANDGISFLQTFDGAAVEIGDMLQRMRELTVQATNGTNGADDITNLNKEFAQLATEIDRVAADTKFNGIDGMSAGVTKSFTIGAEANDTVSVTVQNFNLSAGADVEGANGVKGKDTAAVDIASLKTALQSGGSVSITDDATTITVSLQDIQITANDGSLTSLNGSDGAGANDFDLAQFIAAADAKADASATFTGVIKVGTANSGDSLIVEEKSASFGTNNTFHFDGENLTAVNSVNDTLGVTGGLSGVYGADLSTYKDTSSSSVSEAATITALDKAITNLASARADFGSVINRLEHTVDNLNSSIMNTQAAKSAIVDADYAAETTELARTQIIAQASTAMLSQANQQAQSVLALLK
jgi:flagellin